MPELTSESFQEALERCYVLSNYRVYILFDNDRRFLDFQKEISAINDPIVVVKHTDYRTIIKFQNGSTIECIADYHVWEDMPCHYVITDYISQTPHHLVCTTDYESIPGVTLNESEIRAIVKMKNLKRCLDGKETSEEDITETASLDDYLNSFKVIPTRKTVQ